ncbi:MAG TPA: glycosyltransferase family 4 protein [Candidatus Nanoarchaeia archaeon]|nr:glycosyltransferase family 4 protein [Candidatus Nanoarchaeia archaeon]
MRILVITQKVDEQDAVLGFFHRWLKEFSKKFEFVTVICLERGGYNLPSNVKILSLGKEVAPSKLLYVLNFYKYIWRERKNYDVVFVHMNQEYVLLGWKLWKLMGKKIYMWRNHKMGNVLTRYAVAVSDKVFCTSPGSFTARFKKTILMPVGIDSEFFKKMPEVSKIQNSVLSIGRISPVKHIDVFVSALELLRMKNQNFVAYVYGNPTPVDHTYFSNIKELAADLVKTGHIVFKNEVPNIKTPEVYNAHEIYVNLTDSGSFDKTIVEAMLCESLVLISNESLTDMVERQFVFKDRNAEDLAAKLDILLRSTPQKKAEWAQKLRESAKKHSLEKLTSELVRVMAK